MENDLDLTNMLDDLDGAKPGPEGLRQVISRHRRRRARQYRIVATSAVVVALAGASLGVKLDQSGGAKSAAGPLRPPPGLKWDGSTGAVGRAVTAPSAHGATPSASTSGPEPGEFGFVPSDATSSANTTAYVPVASGTSAGGGYGVTSAKGCATGCSALFTPRVSGVLFSRHVDGLDITASLVTFAFPVSIHTSIPTGRVPITVGSAPTPGSTQGSPGKTSSANSSTPPAGGSSGSAGSATGLSARSGGGTVVPFVGACPTTSELEVTVSAKGSFETLYVPSGGASNRPFSVVASAAARLSSGGSVVLAVARSSSAVSSVSATFASGATDSTRPTLGWSVLGELVSPSADLARAGAVRLVATSSTGGVLERVSLPAAGSLASAPPAPVCRYLVEPVNSTGTASPPTGTVAPAGSGSSGSGTGSTGSTGFDRFHRLDRFHWLDRFHSRRQRPAGISAGALSPSTPSLLAEPEIGTTLSQTVAIPLDPAAPAASDFVEVYEKHFPRLVRALEIGGLDRAAAEDAAQEAFAAHARALASRSAWDEPEWLCLPGGVSSRPANLPP